MLYVKDFDSWNTVKKRINREERNINIRAGEVRWIALGVNVGSEIDGKGVSFARPGLIVDVSGSNYALIVPLSTKVKNVAGYIPFQWKEKTTALCIHQMRVISQKRLLDRIGRISEKRLNEYKENIKRFFSL